MEVHCRRMQGLHSHRSSTMTTRRCAPSQLRCAARRGLPVLVRAQIVPDQRPSPAQPSTTATAAATAAAAPTATTTPPAAVDHLQAETAAAAAVDAADTSSSSSSSSGTCPFLAGLGPEPPLIRMSLWKRFWQLTAPQRLQSMLLDEPMAAGHSMVQMEKQLGFVDAYVPASGDDTRTVFAGEGGSEPITQQGKIPSMVSLLGPNSLLFAAGARHKYLRGLLAPAFSADAVSSYLPQIQELVGRHLADWAAAGEGGVSGFRAFKLLTFEFIVGLTFGRPYERAELVALSDTYQRWTAGFPAWPWKMIPLTPFWSAMRARDAMMAAFAAEVGAGRAALAAGQPVPGLLGNLLTAVDEQGNRLTDPEILDNILLLLLAGHDTSSTTLTRCFANLQEHPAVLQKLRDEQAAVVARHGAALTSAALKDMTYADAVIRETLRLDPVVVGLMRTAVRDFDLGGYRVPAGKWLLLPLKWLASRDARWVDAEGGLAPDRFCPERMLTPEGLKPGDLMPFGHGPRYCLGASLAMVEMKVLLALAARHYAFEANTDTEWVQAVGMIPKNGLPLVITPLQAAV